MPAQSRRDALRTASLVVAGAALAGCTSPENRPAGGPARSSNATFVMVNGAHTAGVTDTRLGLLGHRTVSVQLPGHGPESGQLTRAYQAPQDLQTLATLRSPVAGVTLEAMADRVIEVVRQVRPHGPVILVGSSMAGAIITVVANKIPDQISRLVYDTAMCCVNQRSISEYMLTPEGMQTETVGLAVGAIGDPAVIGAKRVNWRSADPRFIEAAKNALLADGTEAELMTMLNVMQPDEALQPSEADARGNPETWGRIPRTYIRHTQDRSLPLALQDRMIAEADARTPQNKFDVRSVDASHYGTSAAHQKIAEILAGLASV